MTPIFLSIVSLSLIVIQTTVLSQFQILGTGYDLFIVFVIYLCLTQPLRENIVFSIGGGLIMDALSGGPWGVFLTIYIWVNIGFKLGLRVLQLTSPIVISVAVSIAVVFENLVLVILLGSTYNNDLYVLRDSRSLLYQIFWAALTGPMLFWIIQSCNKIWTRWWKTTFRPG
jgi:rod shape-determining protein MreD